MMTSERGGPRLGWGWLRDTKIERAERLSNGRALHEVLVALAQGGCNIVAEMLPIFIFGITSTRDHDSS